MGNFIVSARKYRPETFKSVVGQQSITTTLKNAIKSNHLGHAYLFCGPRGVGKTTCARIFAKTINCSNPTSDNEPCNECESCLAFNSSRSYNIHELDAASNNSVDGIRSLIEQVRIPPQIGKFSVYIIDEVHMLSSQAFNAFLKTLEEPPSHAVFILATTEKHKIIPTILSRCQIFDFNRIKVDDAVKYLEYIASCEKIEYEKEALHIIAQKADGAMRDALSIFDQVVSFSGSDIKYQNVIDNLNILDFEYYFRITDILLEGKVNEALLIFNEILDKGFDPQNFLGGLASHLRDLLVSLDNSTIKLLEVSEGLKSRYQEQSSRCNPEFIYQSLEICNQADLQYRTSHNQRLLIELCLVKLANLQDLKKKSREQQLVEGEQEKPLKTPEKQIVAEKIAPPVTAAKSETAGNDVSPQKKTHIEIDTRTPVEEKKNVVKTSGISIKNMMSPPVTPEKPEVEIGNDDTDADLSEEPVSDIEELKENVFNQEDLDKYWNLFAGIIRQDRPRISSSISSRMPGLLSDYKIEVLMENINQLEDFNLNIKSELQAYLRKNLGNSYIIINARLNEEPKPDANKGRKLYTPEDQFQYLNNKNPNLNMLKQQFGLEFE